MFQSYLIVGSQNQSRQKSEELLKKAQVKNLQNSPDFYLISPEKSSISIEKIRQLKAHIFQKPISAPYKVVIIEQANLLTMQAQNALLKILEEPPSHALIILEAPTKSSLLPTVISRVTTKWAGKDLRAEKVSALENPTLYLENQILKNYQKLKAETINNPGTANTQKYLELINILVQSKQMISSNVNPKFVLANLAFTIK